MKVENQCSNKILSQNYLASKFALTGVPAKTRKVAFLIEGKCNLS